MNKKTLILNEDDFVGNGRHKRCYRLSFDPKKCVKLPYSSDGKKDLDREIAYLKILRTRNKDYSILPKYFGAITTNLGIGHIYEFIQNYDGTPSKTLEDYLYDQSLLESHLSNIIFHLKKLKITLYENEIITMGIFPENIIIEQLSENADDIKLRVINDMGSAALIPIEYYFSYFAKKKISKRWLKFINTLKIRYDFPIVHKLADNIK